MTAEKKLAHRRMSLLALAEKLGNVSRACRHHGVSRSQFYEYKRAFQQHGIDGLVDRAPIPGPQPNEIDKAVREKIIQYSLENPAFGPVRVANDLLAQNVSVSSSSVRNVWLRENMATRYKRLLKLEEKHLKEGFKLTEQQIRLLEKANPCWRECHVESSRPGELLCQDTFFVGRLKGVGRLYLQATVDSFCSLAFAKLYTSKRPETAADLLHDRVIPFYSKEKVRIENILTDNGTEYRGRPMEHLYEIYLEFNDIVHRTTKIGSPRTNGFVERFNRTILDEFFRVAFRKKLYVSVEDLQLDLDAWLKHYNHDRPHQGYRNNGRKPYESFRLGKSARKGVKPSKTAA